MGNHFVILRVIGGSIGLFLLIWAFSRFRLHLIIRRDFFLRTFLGAGLLIVAIYPDSINIFAEMLLFQVEQFGRLLTILIFSNFLLWVLMFGLRSKNFKKSLDLDFLVRDLAQRHFLAEFNLDEIKEITVIIPAYNEAENLDKMLPEIPKSLYGHPLGVLVVDDKSTDNTVDVVKKHGNMVISNPINRGQGAALRVGYDIAISGGAKFIVAMDGDGQHLPEEIERLVKPVLEDEFDIVLGSRILGGADKSSKFREIGIHVFTAIINFLAGTQITDCANGFRAFRVELLQKVLLFQDQFNAAELIIDASRKGLRIGEVPVTIVSRFSGESKKGKDLNYGFNFSKTILKTWLRK